jgi:hypothetical protein
LLWEHRIFWICGSECGAYQSGKATEPQATERFGVSLSFVRDLVRRMRETGSVAPKPHGGGRSLSVHKVTGAEQAIEGAGARLLYLPPYSPDLNPIEQAWSKLKSHLRKAATRTHRTLGHAIRQRLGTYHSSRRSPLLLPLQLCSPNQQEIALKPLSQRNRRQTCHGGNSTSEFIAFLSVHAGYFRVKCSRKSSMIPHTKAAFASIVLLLAKAEPLVANPITIEGQPAVLTVCAAGTSSIRLTLKPQSFKLDFPENPILPERTYPAHALVLREIKEPVTATIAGLLITVQPEPLRLTVTGKNGDLIQSITFEADGTASFALDDKPVPGMGEGGPKPASGSDWRKLLVQFDRRGQFDEMKPHWQSDAYGSRNPVGLLVGTRGWALFFASPWGEFDLRQTDRGRFIPIQKEAMATAQNFANQEKQLGKGLPPLKSFVPGLLDLFIFDAHEPEVFMKDLSRISGAAVMPPKWSLGYMQSHRTLETDEQMIGIVDTFRKKRIPIDAVIYLGTGFTPRGWNTPQPSFDFNPEVFKHEPAEVIAELHKRNVKVALHIVPWDRDRLPTLQGSIPPKEGEPLNSSHIEITGSNIWDWLKPEWTLGGRMEAIGSTSTNA